MQTKTASLCISLALCATCLVVYAPVTGFDFVDLDDPIHLVLNDSYRGLGSEQLEWIFLERHGSAGYDPLAWLSYAVDYSLFGLSPAAFHRTNLAWFTLCVLAFFGLARRVIPMSRPGTSASSKRPPETTSSVAIAGAITALWALHPLRAESVAWVSERHGLLALLFALLSTTQYLRIRSRGLAHVASPGAWTLCLAFFVLALLSKATVVMLPLVFLVLDATLLQRLEWPLNRSNLHDRFVEKLPFFALSLFVGLATVSSRHEAGMRTTIDELGLVGRLSQSLLGLAYYVWKTLVPGSLTPIQLREEWLTQDAAAYGIAALAVAVVAALAFAVRRRAPAVAVALSIYVLLLLPVLGLFQSGALVVADRYSALGLIPLFLLVGVGIERGLERVQGAGRTRAMAAVALCALVLLVAAESWATRRQLEHWRDADALWSHALAQSRAPDLVWLNRALIRAQMGDHTGADRAFSAAISAGRDDARVLAMAGEAAWATGDAARALELLSASIDRDPSLVTARRARAHVYAASGERDRAIRDLEAATRLRPGDSDLQRDLERLRSAPSGSVTEGTQ